MNETNQQNTDSNLLVDPSRIEAVLKHLLRSINVHWKESSESTNRDLLHLAEQDAPGWTVVGADSQTGGRGRHSRAWVSPFGGLYFSILLRCGVTESPVTLLPLTVGLAVYRALIDEARQRGGEIHPRLKWPNDILTENGKLAGILCEAIEENGNWSVIAGIGMNILPLSREVRRLIPDEVTSLVEEADLDWTKSGMVVSILRCLEEEVEQWHQNPEDIRERWIIASGMKDREITVKATGGPFTGKVQGINHNGGLVLSTPRGIIEINSAEGIKEKHV